MHTSDLPEGEVRPFWDGGLEKMQVWVKSHKCNRYCSALELPQLPPTKNKGKGKGKGTKRKTPPTAPVTTERPLTQSLAAAAAPR